jgi:hypothetical protein
MKLTPEQFEALAAWIAVEAAAAARTAVYRPLVKDALKDAREHAHHWLVEYDPDEPT